MNIVFVAPCPTQDDLVEKGAYRGYHGKLMASLMKEAGIDFETQEILYCVNQKAPSQDPMNLLSGKKLKDEYTNDLELLKNKLELLRPNIVVALGPVALYLLSNCMGIRAYRGAVLPSSLVPNLKVIGTYDPDSIRLDWSSRPVFVTDLRKALSESSYPDIRVKLRRIFVAESYDDLEEFAAAHLIGPCTLSVDVETEARQIDCLAIAPQPEVTLVIPIFNHETKGHYFTLHEEIKVWLWVKSLLENRSHVKVFHNAVYDLSYFYHHGIYVNGLVEDTMLISHSLDPEMEKSLGFLGSIYLSESSWKTMNKRPKYEEQKKEE